MLTRLIKTQLVLLTGLALIAVLVLCWYYLRIPSLVGIGRYTLYADLPQSGGLYRTANVTYRGVTIGKVTAVEPTERGARATMSIDNGFQIPVRRVGECALGLGGRRAIHRPGVKPHRRSVSWPISRRSPRVRCPARSARRSTPPTADWKCCPKTKWRHCFARRHKRWADWDHPYGAWSTPPRRSAHDFRGSIDDIDDIIERSAPIIDSQVNSGDDIARWAANLNTLAAQTAAAGSRVAQHSGQRGADRRTGQRHVQRRAGVAAADAGQSRDRDRHAQALPQWRRAGVGVLAAVRRDRPVGYLGNFPARRHSASAPWPSTSRRRA